MWELLRPYARLSVGRDNLDLLDLPVPLRQAALAADVTCVACGELCHAFRARMKSGRSRIAGQVEEHRLFYAATCPSSKNPGCSRTKAAKDHKKRIRREMGEVREPSPGAKVQMVDASGMVLMEVFSQVLEPLTVVLPKDVVALVFKPV
jgi:hypothetical protein